MTRRAETTITCTYTCDLCTGSVQDEDKIIGLTHTGPSYINEIHQDHTNTHLCVWCFRALGSMWDQKLGRNKC